MTRLKRAILPIGLAIILAVAARLVNQEIETAGIIIAAAFGLGIGAALNNFIFKEKKSEEKN